MNNIEIEKLARILNGEKVVCSDKELDEFIKADMNNDVSVLNDVVSVPNPNRVGILDAYLVYKKEVL